MKIIILGSGIIGTTSAYYLALKGHDVTVIDRQAASGMETSFANAGQISPGYTSPWAAPGVPLKAIKWMISQHAPLVINPKIEWDKIKFLARLFSNCNTNDYFKNKERMLRLSEYSRVSLKSLEQDLGCSYDQNSLGTLQLFRSQKQVDAAQQDMSVLDKMNVPFQALSSAECVNYEPALDRVKDKIKGGLRLPLDQTGDCFQMTNHLVKKCQEMGVKFNYNTTINSLITEQGKIKAVVTDNGEFTADQFVMALGSYSNKLLNPIGIHTPVYPVKGYSITLDIKDSSAAPVSTLMDETYKVALTRLGNRIRVAGMAELNGHNLSLNSKRNATLKYVVNDLFPDASDMQTDSFWTGLRPMTPDGTPLIGKTKIDNLYLNTGHGTLGWTMSFGSSRLLADMISGYKTDIFSDDLSLARYKQKRSGYSAPDTLIPFS